MTLKQEEQERIELDRAITAFWQRNDLPEWFRVYAQNYQKWLDLNVLPKLRRIP